MKDDYISRQAAIDAIENAFDRETILNRFVRKIAISAVRLLPSAQPEIIHCNACKHWKQTCGEMKGFGLGECDNFGIKLVTCDGFCYWAEGEKDGRY